MRSLTHSCKPSRKLTLVITCSFPCRSILCYYNQCIGSNSVVSLPPSYAPVHVMAGRGRSGSNADQASTTTTETHLKGTRRKISLVFITVILNILLWSAIVCIAASLYQIVSDPFNTSSYAQVALTIISVCDFQSLSMHDHILICVGPSDDWIYHLSFDSFTQAKTMGTTTAILGRYEKEFYCSYSYSRIDVCALVVDFWLGHDTGRKHTCLFANGTRA